MEMHGRRMRQGAAKGEILFGYKGRWTHTGPERWWALHLWRPSDLTHLRPCVQPDLASKLIGGGWTRDLQMSLPVGIPLQRQLFTVLIGKIARSWATSQPPFRVPFSLKSRCHQGRKRHPGDAPAAAPSSSHALPGTDEPSARPAPLTAISISSRFKSACG